jgi:ABC-2 type transport system ATP-binding protein
LGQGDVGYVLSTPVVPEFLTGYEFVKFFLEITGDPGKSGRTPDDWLSLVGLEKEDRNRLMRGYSHGMKNKMQMLCFLIGQPPVILLDEPLTSFDVVAALEMKNLLREMKDEHIIVFSTHILQLAADLCDEIVVLNHGLLEGVDSSLIHTPEFESRIIEILKDEEPEGQS